MSPFLRDTAERAAKTLVGAFVTFLFEWWLSTLIYLNIPERGAVFAIGTTVISLLASVSSRRVGERGTASITKVVEYERPTE